ncbi:hypothetical protein L249_5943 [Ophiocordyceps polyrhachis-furcata BCC 54312]|uniref:Uncharacterized protein n=1 Tax=Ophiocordyceps polyrhachis-furcata BCC 54312 TaxID=1330021 RepID=A0A367LIT8_9HYPO|nr:hypothetical protein L249_5943 [Ophiocordyceps polyrhachis-furcata BCC 54312]
MPFIFTYFRVPQARPCLTRQRQKRNAAGDVVAESAAKTAESSPVVGGGVPPACLRLFQGHLHLLHFQHPVRTCLPW